MQKYLDSMHTEKPLQIKSAMCTDVKGYIYIEAYKEVHVREATQGLNHLFYRIQQVPNQEMTDVMRVRVASGRRPLVRNSWCRMKQKGDYQDDLAQVVAIENDGNRATVRMIPRLRIYLTRGNDEDEADVARVRPPAKIFKPDEINSWGGEVNSQSIAGRRTFLCATPPRSPPPTPRSCRPRSASLTTRSPRASQIRRHDVRRRSDPQAGLDTQPAMGR